MAPERGWNREACFEPCMAEVDGTGERLVCHLLDYSFTGVRLGVDRPLPPGTRLRVRLKEQSKSGPLASLLLRPGAVAWCQPAKDPGQWFFEVGLQLAEPSSPRGRKV